MWTLTHELFHLLVTKGVAILDVLTLSSIVLMLSGCSDWLGGQWAISHTPRPSHKPHRNFSGLRRATPHSKLPITFRKTGEWSNIFTLHILHSPNKGMFTTNTIWKTQIVLQEEIEAIMLHSPKYYNSSDNWRH
jgi:hypothetical protein